MKAQHWFGSLAAVVLATDLAILLDIPFIRPVLAFLTFTLVPGLLLLHILRLTPDPPKRVLLSTGLGVTFLMLLGLLVDQLYYALGVSRPLTTLPLLLSFTPILLALAFWAYWRNRGERYSFSLHLPREPGQAFCLWLFPLLFPLLSLWGISRMNAFEDNRVMLAMLFLMPAYALFVLFFSRRVPSGSYPLAIWGMALALLLMFSLRSNYLLGTDLFTEFYSFQLVADFAHWRFSDFPTPLQTLLGTTILPTVYQALMDINPLYIYKAVFPLLASLIPVASYFLFRGFLPSHYAFLSAFFLIAQIPFIYILPYHARQEIGLLFVALVLMVTFDRELGRLRKDFLRIAFLPGMVVSHYTVVYAFLAMIAFASVAGNLVKRWLRTAQVFSGALVMLAVAETFVWYAQVTEYMFGMSVGFLTNIMRNLTKFFLEDLRQSGIRALFRPGEALNPSTAQTITVYIHWVTFFLLSVGVLYLLLRSRKRGVDPDYVVMVAGAWAILAFILVFPFVGASPERIYIQMMVLLAPALLFGVAALCRSLEKWYSRAVISLVLVSQFLAGTLLVYQIEPVPYSELYNARGIRYDLYYVHEKDMAAAKWLTHHDPEELPVWGDWQTGFVFQLVAHSPDSQYGMNYRQPGDLFRLFILASEDGDSSFSVRGDLFRTLKMAQAKRVTTKRQKGDLPAPSYYIFLRQGNTSSGKAYFSSLEDGDPLEEFSFLFADKAKVYTNGGAEVYR